jgi:asparagine synthase (glutamine-hydrolysing)
VCGIAGIFRFDGNDIDAHSLQQAVDCLNKRGPDAKGTFIDKNIGLGHTRLAIIDPEPSSNQPFHDESGRYVLVYNGEIFNYKQLRNELEQAGNQFQTKSDTEVLLQLLIKEGSNCLSKLNGFFAFAFYDKQTHKLLLARDRFGVKPLYICKTDTFFAFASEMKSLVALGVPKKLDYASLLFYFQLNYIPSPNSIFEDVKKLPQAHWMAVNEKGNEDSGCYYTLKIEEEIAPYEHKKSDLRNLLSQAVLDRLVSDVPVGVFLSGGVDSSIVSLLAKRHMDSIHSFSIGFKDSPFFDESVYAEKVAKHLKLEHHTFFLSNQNMLDNLEEMLLYVDEPFADSSAIAVFNLCQYTRKHVTVALTGDGSDEIFGGYNKHLAELKIRQKTVLNTFMNISSPFLNHLPESRSGHWGNAFRKLKKYSQSVSLSEAERYWAWCSFTQESDAMRLFSPSTLKAFSENEYHKRRKEKLGYFERKSSIDNALASDVNMVLEGDMLVKTDRMSMANSLELRNPFLDPRVVDFAFGLNENDKVSNGTTKKILKEAFKSDLPTEVFNRPKHGFEVPLLKWLNEDLHHLVDQYLSLDFLEEQGIFQPEYIAQLVRKLRSNNPGDVAQRIWGLVIFQHCWKKFLA